MKRNCLGLLEIAGDHGRLLDDTGGLPEITGGYWESLEITGGYWGLLHTCGGHLRYVEVSNI